MLFKRAKQHQNPGHSNLLFPAIMDYKTSGVDVEAGRAFVNEIKSCVDSTRRPEVIGGLGGFGGFMRLPGGLSNPVLVAGTDGVGTKLELAQQYDAHFGVGIDLVAMCVNDVITCGAEPLFFLDYIAAGALAPAAMVEVIEGVSAGCRASGCALLGGETAEMPGFYAKGQYDLAGFCVGVIEENLLINGQNIQPGDQIIGIKSSGIHSNGFSLVRKILEINEVTQESSFGNNREPIINTLLEPTQLYGALVKDLRNQSVQVNGMSHITGGGLPENLPRCFPKGLCALIDPQSWERPPIFSWLQEAGNIAEEALWNTFNLGIGFCLVVPRDSKELALEVCMANSLKASVIGSVEESQDNAAEKVLGLPFSI